ncbi:MAG: DUF4249 family protein [Saprospiraceae bacterium]
MKIIQYIYFIPLFFLIACEREYTPTDVNLDHDIVVEGYIESSDRPIPPYVILTKSASFFREFDPNKLEQLIVRDALVTISDGKLTDTLTQFCLNSLSPNDKKLVSTFLGFDADSLGGADLCIYTKFFGRVKAVDGGVYYLTVKAEGKTLTSVTTIPYKVPLDSIKLIPTFNNGIDSMMQMRGFISDPGGVKNFYRYMIAEEGKPFFARSNSVINDNFFDGKPSFEFPISKPNRPNDNSTFETRGLYKKGEKVTLKYMYLDEAQFDFWRTAEQSSQNQGPFSTYTRINSNIFGGLGLWGGFSATYYDIQVPK